LFFLTAFSDLKTASLRLKLRRRHCDLKDSVPEHRVRIVGVNALGQRYLPVKAAVTAF
jgi:hypothetical protein